jgi:hypothetical protein
LVPDGKLATAVTLPPWHKVVDEGEIVYWGYGITVTVVADWQLLVYVWPFTVAFTVPWRVYTAVLVRIGVETSDCVDEKLLGPNHV